MARKINRLSARAVSTLTKPGRHADGAGLYLSISNDDSGQRRRWVYLFNWNGKLKEMGLGSAMTVSLAQAREFAAKARLELRNGNNPIDLRKTSKKASSKGRTFHEIAEQLHADKSKGWRNLKVQKQWMNPLNRYASRLMDMRVNEITTEDILACLKPIWTTKSETASRVRARTEAVIDAAKARGLISPNEANPARWRGHLSHLLPKRRKLYKGHLPAMPYADVPEFLLKLQSLKSNGALALEFTILTAARTGEVLGARWDEIDTKANVWTVPANRMKTAKEHRVPLCKRALEIVQELGALRDCEFVFPNLRRNGPLSNMAMEMVLRRMKVKNATVHGFRSSFRDWAGECTSFPREIAEAALSHRVGNEVELAYRRGDALSKRRELMQLWCDYCKGKTNIVEFSKKSKEKISV